MCSLKNAVRGTLHAVLVTLLIVGDVASTELVYVPTNPSFGGSPLNGAVLLNSANAQNKYKDPDDLSSRYAEKTPLQQFNDTLERSVVGQLANAATSGIVGANGKLIPGSVETGNFRISIADLGGGTLQISTTDKSTGGVTSFQVGQ